MAIEIAKKHLERLNSDYEQLGTRKSSSSQEFVRKDLLKHEIGKGHKWIHVALLLIAFEKSGGCDSRIVSEQKVSTFFVHKYAYS